MKFIATDKAAQAVGPYSQAVSVNGFIYTSGQIPIDGRRVNWLMEQLRIRRHQVFENLKAVLEAGDSSLDKVVKATVFITDMNDFAKVNEIYAHYFG